jgi:citrate lyase subunit beta/citryl-CoA lyase
MRSVLFAGATRPDLVGKLPRSGPDAVVVDLEDAVPEDHKVAARNAAREQTVALVGAHSGLRVFVRVNAPATDWFADDVRDALHGALTGVLVPKVESADDIAQVRKSLSLASLDDLQLFVGIETARGVARVDEILRRDVAAAYFGAEDYIADVGGRRRTGDDEVLYARSRVVLSARLNGVVAVDMAHIDVRDSDGFRRSADRGRDLGYDGKLCVHPEQVRLANEIFGALPREHERAERMIAAAEEAARRGVGAIEFEGVMVDEPALRMARNILGRPVWLND